jgi:tetratricopeptide (TPR) repeat protein
VSNSQYVEAVSLYNEAIRSAPTDASLYLERAMCRELQSDFDGAISDYRKFIELGGDVQRGNLSQVEEAIRQLEAARHAGTPYRSPFNTLEVRSGETLLRSIPITRFSRSSAAADNSTLVHSDDGTANPHDKEHVQQNTMGQNRRLISSGGAIRGLWLLLLAALLLFVVGPIGLRAYYLHDAANTLRNPNSWSADNFISELADALSNGGSQTNRYSQPSFRESIVNYTQPLVKPVDQWVGEHSQANTLADAYDVLALSAVAAAVVYLIAGVIGIRILTFAIRRILKASAPASR